jgi:pyruvate dehydrogenase E1 component alpha subunit
MISACKKSFPGLSSISKYCFSEGSITVDLPKFDTHRFDVPLPKQATATKSELIKYYQQFQVLRRMEIACDNLYKNREIRGFCHLYDGQEAIAVGIEPSTTFEDCLITAYRDHCQQRLRGDTTHQVIAELMGKITGSTKGRGGSMHLYRKKNNFYGGHGIVGAQVPLGVGLAFGLKYMDKPNVAIAMYGDGAANQGQIFEVANIAGLQKLPAIFVCENNHYGMGTSTARAAHNTNFYQRGDLIPGIRIDGQNVLAVRESVRVAKEYAIKNGPIFLEFQTYRYHGHSMSDPGISYRTREEVSNMRKTKDCIDYVRGLLIDNKLASEQELKDIDKAAKEETDAAVEQARKDPFPNAGEHLENVYSNNTEHWIRGVESTQSGYPKK